MDSRTKILNAIKSALGNTNQSNMSLPELSNIGEYKRVSIAEKIKRFSENLKAVAGESVVCSDFESVITEISLRLRKLEQNTNEISPSFLLGAYNSDLVKSLVSNIGLPPNWRVEFPPEDPEVDSQDYQYMTASLVSSNLLLADTGSCVVEAHSAFERLLCYLSPVCFVLARASQLRENLFEAWNEIETLMKKANQHGETAIITGPSRTADIEKKLVLGVHGPQILYVFIINDN